MGEVVFFAAYRRDRAAEPAPELGAAPDGIQHACGDFLAGLDRMRTAARILSEATAELRELAREQ